LTSGLDSNLIVRNFELVRKSFLHIISSAFLISSLLFTQLAINFFHRNHDVHEVKSALSKPNSSPEFNKHDEHCKLCSIDFFNHAFDHHQGTDLAISGGEIHYVVSEVSVLSSAIYHFKSRAPPVA
jgi:hypothetical protein